MRFLSFIKKKKEKKRKENHSSLDWLSFYLCWWSEAFFLPNLTLLLSSLVLLVHLNIDEVDLPMEKRDRFCVFVSFFICDR